MANLKAFSLRYSLFGALPIVLSRYDLDSQEVNNDGYLKPTQQCLKHFWPPRSPFFERGLIQERTQAGLKAARARGHKGGRPRLMTATKIKQAQILAADSSMTVGEICKILGISRDTYYRYVR